ncbi:hypothetical protein PROFUN_14737 [Planoprotostelium fungivorum]|uniref:Uncharacterized protein n=1 Tax=Planoprotostelium fungivorum TaxID=1890364 RepID=A0A2P6MXX4_9EUKA|nr:hypothetical protein PROFUN_14737 [Planoprotostelium fungivorum]
MTAQLKAKLWLSPNSPNLSFYSAQQGVNSPPLVDSGTPHLPSLPLSTCAQMPRRIAIVSLLLLFFRVCRVQSYQLASNGLVAPSGVKLISE